MKTVFVLLFTAGIAQAEPRPAPDYFISMTFAASTAQALAQACPTLSFELLRASRASGDVMQRLVDDGFDLDALEDEMIDPAPDFDARRSAFLTRHNLAEGAPSDAVCRAGHAEITEESEIGGYLTAVDP